MTVMIRVLRVVMMVLRVLMVLRVVLEKTLRLRRVVVVLMT
jgi:hypothetical protein